jgi:hypothetical protein
MVWYGMVWYGMVWYGMVWYGMVWYGIVRYHMIWIFDKSKQPYLQYVKKIDCLGCGNRSCGVTWSNNRRRERFI